MRLAGGLTNRDGRLEVQLRSQPTWGSLSLILPDWYSLSDSPFSRASVQAGDRVAATACRQLGYASGIAHDGSIYSTAGNQTAALRVSEEGSPEGLACCWAALLGGAPDALLPPLLRCLPTAPAGALCPPGGQPLSLLLCRQPRACDRDGEQVVGRGLHR